MNERQAQYLQLLGIQAWCKQEDLPRIREVKKELIQLEKKLSTPLFMSDNSKLSHRDNRDLQNPLPQSIALPINEAQEDTQIARNPHQNSFSQQLQAIVGGTAKDSRTLVKPQPIQQTKTNVTPFNETEFQFSQNKTIFEKSFLEAIQSCQGCSFAQSRLQAVLPRQQSSAKVMIITDIPLKEESRQGIVLDRADESFFFKAMNQVGFQPENLYITPFIKCRPPELRDVEDKEWEACAPILYREIEAVNPAIIFILGRTSVKFLLKKELPFESLRQAIHSLTIGNSKYPVVISHSPRVYAKNPRLKSNFWQDLKYLRHHIQQ